MGQGCCSLGSPSCQPLWSANLSYVQLLLLHLKHYPAFTDKLVAALKYDLILLPRLDQNSLILLPRLA